MSASERVQGHILSDVQFLEITGKKASWSFESGWNCLEDVCSRLDEIEKKGVSNGRLGEGSKFIANFMRKYQFEDESDEFMFFSVCLVAYKASIRNPPGKIANLKGVSKSLVYSPTDLSRVVDASITYADPDFLSALTCATSKSNASGKGKYRGLEVSLRQLDRMGRDDSTRGTEMNSRTKVMFDPYARTNQRVRYVYILNSNGHVLRTVVGQMNYIAWCHVRGIIDRAIKDKHARPLFCKKNVPDVGADKRHVIEHLELREGCDERGKEVQDGVRRGGDSWAGSCVVVS